jgi:hypothetical protein
VKLIWKARALIMMFFALACWVDALAQNQPFHFQLNPMSKLHYALCAQLPERQRSRPSEPLRDYT